MTKTHLLWAVGAVAALLAGLSLLLNAGGGGPEFSTSTPEKAETGSVAKKPTAPRVTYKDYRNGTFVIDGKSVTLKDGSAVTSIPGSSTKLLTQIYGNNNEVMGDINRDGLTDVAFFLTQTTGGTGVFYYAVMAVRNLNGYQSTNAVYLGDRIRPVGFDITKGQLLVNIADRKKGDPMTTAPTIGVSKYYTYSGGVLIAR